MPGSSATHRCFARFPNVHIHDQAPVFARGNWIADLFANFCVTIPFLLLALCILQPVHSLVSGARNILNSFGRSNRLININNALWLWYQGEVVHHGTAVGNSIGRENKVFAAVRESLLVPCEFDDFHRLFKCFAVDAIVFGRHGVIARGNNCAEAPCLARNSSTSDANFHATAGDDVGQCEVFS